MQKKLIALAVAGLAATGAYAQSNVTIYGVADGSFEQVKATGVSPNAAPVSTASNMSSRQRVNSNNSLIGFKGAESLGNGLTAVFQFETNVGLGGNNATQNVAGSSNLLGSQRDTYVGLSSAAGTFAAGYLSTPTRSTLTAFDVMPGATGVGGINTLLGRVNFGGAVNPVNANGTVTNTFGTTTVINANAVNSSGAGNVANNQNTVFRTTALAYISPNFNGFSGVLAYVPNAAKDMQAVGSNLNAQGAAVANAAVRDPSAWNASLSYDANGIKLAYAYLHAADADLFNINGGNANYRATLAASGYTGETKLDTHILGASYKLPMGLTLSAVYDKETAKAGTNVNAAANNALQKLSRTAWWVGAKYELGANEFALSYAKVGDNKTTYAGVLAANTNFGDTGAKQVTLRYGYNLSKRTQVYGVYSKVTNGNNANFDLFNGSGVSTAANSVSSTGVVSGTATNAGADISALGVGLRHSF